MTILQLLLTRLYDKVILNRPWLVISCIIVIVSFLAYQAKDFRLDASAETLVLENDKDLKFSRVINSRYGESDYLLIAYTPKGDLFSVETLTRIKSLRDELKGLERVSSVVTILDVPLLESPPVPVKELASNIRTLESPTVDIELARHEFHTSPIYNNLLVSPDLKTTALIVNFPDDKTYRNLLIRRNKLRDEKTDRMFTVEENAEFQKVSKQFKEYRARMKALWHEDIAHVRHIMNKHRDNAELFLGGVNMIADDLITFIKNDLKVFGIGVLFFLVITLKFIFNKLRWIILPMLCCAFSAISMMGLLGMFDWEVTVISSNFISLQLIITMAITIHLIVRYRELHNGNPEAGHKENIMGAVRLMIRPCVYAALTTVAGFGSLVLCDILPVKTFGWMMIAGIIVSLVLTFLLFPAGLMLFKAENPTTMREQRFSLTSILAHFTEKNGKTIMIISAIVFVLSLIGMSRLEVENSFIEYFKDTTEIYQGMKVIDQKLGGTTPLDVIVDFEKQQLSGSKDVEKTNGELNSEFDEFDEFDKAEGDEKYWFTSDKMAKVVDIHNYLDKLPEKVQVVMVNESGASVYSASAAAREEFPDQDVTVRGAVSIGRRLMDPLAELVKIDPKSIGVGQYQHDVDQKALGARLDDAVMSCVNAVGVEVNTASMQLLTYVSGLGPQLAKNIVTYRDEHGPYRSRKLLKKVPRLGDKAFEQAAGFLRIMGGDNPLDASAVHPESYFTVESMAKDLHCSVNELIEDEELRKKIIKQDYVSDTVGMPTLNDILKELAKPGRDPRKEFESFAFAEEVQKMEDLQTEMKLPGIVTNVTAFGAFVDIGVHQDGLVHISNLANRFVKDPNDEVKVHQKVWVTVLDIDLDRKRISLSMKDDNKANAPDNIQNKKRAAKKASPHKTKTDSTFFNNPFEKALKGGK